MDAAIISRCNEVVGVGDTLYHLGDVSWSSFNIQNNYLSRLVCKNVHLILGNHDNLKPSEYLSMGFITVSTYKEIRQDVVRGTPQSQGSSKKVILCHYPFRSWEGKGKGGYDLYGHCHGSLEPGLDRSMDVGVDTHDFYPWSWDEIKEKLEVKPIFSNAREVEN